MTAETAPARARSQPGFAEFVALLALLIGLTAFGIDTLLPAFPAIGADYAVEDANQLQYLVYAYMIGFAVTQLVYGPLADMLGRRPVMVGGLLIFAAGTVLGIVAGSFETLIVARVIQGAGAASARVLAVSIVRDRFSGREMARVMSFVMMVFIIVPVFAPALGSLILLVGSWHLQFVAILLLVLAVLAWFVLRMPETLAPDDRMPVSAGRLAKGVAFCLSKRVSVGYASAVGVMSGCLMAYIGSAEQIFGSDVYALGPWFPLAFGLIACVMGVGGFVSSRLVVRLGMRRLGHGALVGYVIIAALMVLAALLWGGHPPLLVFGGLLAATNFLFSLTLPNFNALAMEPLGAVAGTASSLIGFYTTLLGALLGLWVGQSFDGTVTPLAFGYLIFSATTLALVVWTEGGRLFQARPQA